MSTTEQTETLSGRHLSRRQALVTILACGAAGTVACRKTGLSPTPTAVLSQHERERLTASPTVLRASKKIIFNDQGTSWSGGTLYLANIPGLTLEFDIDYANRLGLDPEIGIGFPSHRSLAIATIIVPDRLEALKYTSESVLAEAQRIFLKDKREQPLEWYVSAAVNFQEAVGRVLPKMPAGSTARNLGEELSKAWVLAQMSGINQAYRIQNPITVIPQAGLPKVIGARLVIDVLQMPSIMKG